MRGALRTRLRLLAAALRRSGSRAVLAVAAVAAGVAAQMLTLALGAGAERELAEIADRVGRNLYMVTAGQVRGLPGRGAALAVSTRLDRDDVALLVAAQSELAAIVPVLEGSRRVKLGRRETTTTVRGVPPEFVPLRRFELAAGRALDAADEARRARVAVVGAFVAERLGEGAPLEGRTILVGGVPFEVVGTLVEKGLGADGQNDDDQVLVPLETARTRVFRRESFSRLIVQAATDSALAPAQETTRALLRAEHRVAAGARDDFEVLPLVPTNEIRRRSGEFLRGMSALFATATLAVGGLGVLAVTFLNVKDRTAEIGLRRAVGARRRDVALLFVGEAVALAVLGALAGLAAGAAAIATLERTVGWRMAIDLATLAAPVATAIALGVGFGVLPALRAARILPVQALRDL